jgi:hypothetical protein
VLLDAFALGDRRARFRSEGAAISTESVAIPTPGIAHHCRHFAGCGCWATAYSGVDDLDAYGT